MLGMGHFFSFEPLRSKLTKKLSNKKLGACIQNYRLKNMHVVNQFILSYICHLFKGWVEFYNKLISYIFLAVLYQSQTPFHKHHKPNIKYYFSAQQNEKLYFN